MTSQKEPQVLIIGGGIVGLSASLFLSYHGISSLLVERRASTSIHPRARSVNARTMEFFRRLGIENAVREAGASMSATMGIYSGTSLHAIITPHKRDFTKKSWPFASLGEGISPVRGEFVTQDMLEPVLLDVARKRGGEVRFRVECTGVEQVEEGVVATLKDRESSVIETVRAKYLIAADGANSPIRKHLQTPTSGRGTMGHLLNILFHANLEDFVAGRNFSLCKIETPEVCGLFASINNRDVWVFQLYYDPEKGKKAADFPPERCKELLRIALGMPEVELEIKSILPWEPTVQIAEKLNHGRIFLAGDAAHQMPPWAGQGANSGIADVHNLAWKLASVLNGHASKSLLETYEKERIPVGRMAAEASAVAADEKGIISTKKNFATAKGLASRIRILSGHGYSYTSDAISTENTFPLGGLTWKPWSIPSLGLGIDGRPGTRVPHLWINSRDDQAKGISTLDLCGKNFVLLTGAQGKPWIEAAKDISSEIGVKIDAYCIGASGEFMCAESFEGAAGITDKGAILVRQDDFVVWRERRMPSDLKTSLEGALRKALCL